MPIIPFLRGQAFDPETIEAMAAAFSKTCDALGLIERTDPISNLVAEKIIELAERGLRNPTAIHFMVMKELKSNSHRRRSSRQIVVVSTNGSSAELAGKLTKPGKVYTMRQTRPFAKSDTLSKVPPVEPLLLCTHCNVEMCLLGIESESAKRDLYTFECIGCGALEVRGVHVR